MNNPLESKFGKVLASFQATLTQDEFEDFRFTTLDDLKQAVAEIQAVQGSTKRLQNLRRLDAFLEAMEQYERVVQIFLNSADLLGLIWGPAKFMLMTASTWSEAFNTLLDAYGEIGDHIPLLKQYEENIKQSVELRSVLEMIYKDILGFHQRAISYFKKRVWKQLFHAAWKTFRTDFQAVLKNLKSHKGLLDSQAILTGIQESQNIREKIEDDRHQRQRSEEIRRRREVFAWLAAADSAEGQETASEARYKCPTTGRWILQERLVSQWCDLHSHSEPCLWINGKPGAGKTVLTSVLVDECNSIEHTNVAYFYCRSEDCSRNTFVGLCKSLICQLAQRDSSIMSYAYEKSSSSGRYQLDTVALAKEMLDVVLNAFDSLFIIIDGIDECKKIEKERISSTLISLAESSASVLRCCFISQHDKDTGKLFRAIPTFQITEHHNMGDILDYCVEMESTIARSFQISATEIQHLGISQKVAAKADGMFLFAKLVMENLLQQYNRASLRAEIERIPPDLDKAYDRLLVRILRDAPTPESHVAKRLLCWFLCTKRPLRWHEVQGAMSIDTEELNSDYQERSLRKDLKTFCGSLVEVRKSGTIQLVHQTARCFLEKQEELQLGLEEVNFTSICLSNLALPSHDDDLSDDSIRHYIQEGYYGLSDYSVVYWQEHLNQLIREKTLDNEESLKVFNAAISSFLNRRFTPSAQISSRSTRPNSHLSRFKGKKFYSQFVQAMENTHNEQSSLSKSSQDCQPVVAQLLTVREIMERMIFEADPRLKKRLQMLYGPNLFKCPELRCRFFHEGFALASERNAHMQKHKRAFFCIYPGCPSSLIGFATSVELKKHSSESHKHATDEQSFPWYYIDASAAIEKQIKDGNLSAVQAWADQWEAQIPMENLWFSKDHGGFDRSPLGLAIRYDKEDVFKALLCQAPDELFEQIHRRFGQFQSPGYQLFADTMRSGNEAIVDTYLKNLKKLEKIDVSLFTAALQLHSESKMIVFLLQHAATGGDMSFRDNSISYLSAAVEAEHAASIRYLLLDLGLMREQRATRNSKRGA